MAPPVLPSQDVVRLCLEWVGVPMLGIHHIPHTSHIYSHMSVHVIMTLSATNWCTCAVRLSKQLPALALSEMQADNSGKYLTLICKPTY